MEREADVTLKLKVGDEVIETTAEHPFYTQDGWKDAADLSTSDILQTRENTKKTINSIESSYKSKKVFNFAVADWSTYFVGIWGWLVHNAKTCMSGIVKKISLRLKYPDEHRGRIAKQERRSLNGC
jgi:hypothetical protein